MAAEGVIGVDVIVKVGGTAILGQRGATMNYPVELTDMRVKADWPNWKQQPGWEGPCVIKCDALLMAGGTGGIASLITTVQARTLVAVVVTIGDSGEELTGDAWMVNPEMGAPQEGEGTMSCELIIDGALTATEGV